MGSSANPEPAEITQNTNAAELYFGDVRFSERSVKKVLFAKRRKGNLGIRSASVHVVPSAALR